MVGGGGGGGGIIIIKNMVGGRGNMKIKTSMKNLMVTFGCKDA